MMTVPWPGKKKVAEMDALEGGAKGMLDKRERGWRL
jgi:hypothetical protein